MDLVLAKVSNSERISAEMVRSISSLVDSITTAANALIVAEADAVGLQIKSDLLELKKRELDLKALTVPGQKIPSQQNIFVGSFGELLKQINNQPPKAIENDEHKE